MSRVLEPQAVGDGRARGVLQRQHLLGRHGCSPDAQLLHVRGLALHDIAAAYAEADLVVTVAPQQILPADPGQPALPGGRGGLNQGRQRARMGIAPECRHRESPDPRQHAQRLARRHIQRSAKAHQFAPEAEQQRRGGERLHQFGGDMAHVAVAGAGDARLGAIVEQHPAALARQRQRHGRADDCRRRSRRCYLAGPWPYRIRSTILSIND